MNPIFVRSIVFFSSYYPIINTKKKSGIKNSGMNKRERDKDFPPNPIIHLCLTCINFFNLFFFI